MDADEDQEPPDDRLKANGWLSSVPRAAAMALPSDEPPSFQKININSSTVGRIGPTNVYKGPVTIVVSSVVGDDRGEDRIEPKAIKDKDSSTTPTESPTDTTYTNGLSNGPKLSTESAHPLFSNRRARVADWCRMRRWTVMICGAILLLVIILSFTLQGKGRPPQDNQPSVPAVPNDTSINNGELRIIERRDWFAKEAEIPPIILKTLPPTYVIIIHTMLEHCTTKEKCIDTVRNIQNNHLKHYGDIAFNFLVGGDGSIYVGRGWGVMGNHTYGYDSNSLGIAFIGNYENKRPTNTQIEATINFFILSVKEQKLSHNYKLLGQRQVAATDSPGDKLFEIITTWKHWNSGGLLFVTRADWKAAEPRRPPEKLDTLPPTYVIIIHTTSQSCSTREACDQSVGFIQTSQMKFENLQDIGYNFLVGGDGSVYVGRGWEAAGEHTIGYNRTSLGIAFIGDFQMENPTDKQLSAAMKLLQFGVTETMLDKEYVVLGQRQAKLTESPGDKLYSIIKNWDHWRKDPVKGELNFVTKAEWRALPTKPSKQFLELPLSYVIIIHTVTPSCMTSSECIKTVRSIQSSQIHEKGLDDIAYNFLIGGDGSVYIGRGWDVEGAHTIDYNATSIGIAFIGDYRVENPTQEQIVVAQKLLEFGVTQKKLTKNYFLLGQNQAMITSSPGDNLYNIIKTWEHWREGPIKGDGPELVTRDEWNAASPWTPNENLTTRPPLYVIINHSYTTILGEDTYCTTKTKCIYAVRRLQSEAFLNYKNDIEHNFLIGGDSLVYEGRGWDKKGEHTPGYNEISISIAFIGNYELIEPTKEQINATKELLKYGIRKNKLAEKYKLLGQCQLVSYTSSPGTHLYANIQTWEHWSPKP